MIAAVVKMSDHMWQKFVAFLLPIFFEIFKKNLLHIMIKHHQHEFERIVGIP